MKRHESIAPLSRDHHTALLCCWKIRQGIKNNIDTERMNRYVAYFRENHLQHHFEEEENILFKEVQHDLCEQAIAQHRQLIALVNSIALNSSILTLNRFADALEQHIRFEEREVFPYLETALPEEKLQYIGKQLQALHAAGGEDKFEDTFWA